jgi:hypothetical protein
LIFCSMGLLLIVGVSFIDLVLSGNVNKLRLLFALVLPLLYFSIFVLDDITIRRLYPKVIDVIILFFVLINLKVSLEILFKYYTSENNLRLAKIEKTKLIDTFFEKNPEQFYVLIGGHTAFDLYKTPKFNFENRYELGGLAGSPFNATKIKEYTGKNDIGIYTIFNKEINWFFTRKSNKCKKVIDFYLSNFPDCKIKEVNYYLSKNDSLLKISVFIPK